jgi:hypothetical protein
MMIYSLDTKNKMSALVSNPPQLIILVGAKGSGKENIMQELSLGITKQTNIFSLQPLEGKKTIGIDQLRQIKKSSFLTKRLPQVIIIPNAELLTIEAQNSMLKLLEDTPQNLHIFMATTTENKLLETIRSRAYIWRIVNPSKAEIKDYYKTEDAAKLEQAILITAQKSRQLDDYLKDDSSSTNIELAKEILGEQKFDRLQRVNILIKDINLTVELIEAIIVICETAIHMAANQNNLQKIEPWKNRLNNCLIAIDQLEKSVQPKLVITRLFMML